MTTFPLSPQTSLSIPTTPKQDPAHLFGTLSSFAGLTEDPVDQNTNRNYDKLTPCEPSWFDENFPWPPSSTVADSRSHEAQFSSSHSASDSDQMQMHSRPSFSAPSPFAPQTAGQAFSSGWTSASSTLIQSSAERPQSLSRTPKTLDSKSKSPQRPTQTTLVLDDLDPATMASIMQVIRQSGTRATITMNM